MSLALPAALLLLLVLPGYIFVYTYKGRLRPQNDALVSNASMTASWIIGLLGAIVAHALWVPLCNCLLRRTGQSLRVDMNSVAYLLAGEYKEGFHSAASALTNYPYQVMGYFASLYVVAAALGALSHYLVRTGRWDRRFRSLRFNNKWYYLFSPDVPITGVVVTVTCQHKDQTSLYTGVLESYDFTADGQLELLVLISAARAQLSPNASTTPVFSPIPESDSCSGAEMSTRSTSTTCIRSRSLSPLLRPHLRLQQAPRQTRLCLRFSCRSLSRSATTGRGFYGSIVQGPLRPFHDHRRQRSA